MIVGIGVDLIEIERIERAMERHGERFLRKLFTPAEIAYSTARLRPAQHLAGRFAAKEAVLKAMGIGIHWGSALQEIEVRRLSSGMPEVSLSGRVAARARKIGADRFYISLSHTGTHAIAQAVAERVAARVRAPRKRSGAKRTVKKSVSSRGKPARRGTR